MTQTVNTGTRRKAFATVTLVYLLALLAAIPVGYFTAQSGYSLLVSLAVADVVGTIVVFAFSYFYDNSSFYDPYWSVIPILIVSLLAYIGWQEEANLLRLLALLFLVLFWGIRLTYNWGRGWKGLHQQDWRYVDLQEKHGFYYWWVSFAGIHFFPTVLVYLGCLPLFHSMTEAGSPLELLDVLAFLFTFGAIMVELVADEQLHRFVKEKKQEGDTLTTGLWAFSRHPNYVGETAFWWGLYLVGLAANPAYWWTIIGPISISLLFHFISIPMIERRMLKRRANYVEIQNQIPRWFPIWKR